jgi:hypothetical protein
VATWGRPLLCIALASLIAPACSGSDDGDGTAAPGSGTTTASPARDATTTAPPTTASRPTTTTTAPLYSFDNSVPPPKLVNTGTNYKRILQSLLDYEEWLASSRPDSKLVANIAAPGSQHERAQIADLTKLDARTQRFYEVERGPARFEVLSVEPTAVNARLVQQLKTQLVVDKRGTVRERRDVAEPTTSYLVLMIKGEDDHWRIASLTPYTGTDVTF